MEVGDILEQFSEEKIKIIVGDITGMHVDAIVNAANSSLLGGGGVDGAIHREGGPEILKECKDIRRHQYPQGLPAGKAVITTAGNLPSAHVIHTVGPVWKGGQAGERETLADAYKNCLVLAAQTGINTIAFPAISTGVYGFPKDLAGRIAYRTISDFLQKKSLPREVDLVFFADSDRDIFLDSIRTKGSD